MSRELPGKRVRKPAPQPPATLDDVLAALEPFELISREEAGEWVSASADRLLRSHMATLPRALRQQHVKRLRAIQRHSRALRALLATPADDLTLVLCSEDWSTTKAALVELEARCETIAGSVNPAHAPRTVGDANRVLALECVVLHALCTLRPATLAATCGPFKVAESAHRFSTGRTTGETMKHYVAAVLRVQPSRYPVLYSRWKSRDDHRFTVRRERNPGRPPSLKDQMNATVDEIIEWRPRPRQPKALIAAWKASSREKLETYLLLQGESSFRMPPR